MKILYIGYERASAELAAGALHGIAQDFTVSWAQSPGSGLEWLQDNRDAAAVIVEVHTQSCASLVAEVRALGLDTPIVVTGSTPGLEANLGLIVASAIEQRGRLERLAAQVRALEGTLARETRIGTTLQDRLLEVEQALRTAEEHNAAEVASFADQLARRHVEFTASLASSNQAREALAAKLALTSAALDDAREARAADAATAADHLHRREEELGAALAAASGARTVLQEALAVAQAERQEADHRATVALADAAVRQAELSGWLAQECDTRAALERALAEARAESASTRRKLLTVAASYRQRGVAQKQRLEAAIARDTVERLSLQQALSVAQEQVRHLNDTLEKERSAHERTRAAGESELQRLFVEHTQLRQSFESLQTAFQTLEKITGEHVTERGRLEAALANRDTELRALEEQHRIDSQTAQEALTRLRERYRQTVERSDADIAHLFRQNDAVRQELDATRKRADALRVDAERVPGLMAELSLSQKERRREFERAPYGLCRCTPEGTITDANHSFVMLLGRRRVEELRGVDFTAAITDCAGDVSWLLERARTTRKTEAVETRWKNRDGRQLVVRLQAFAATTGSIEVVAEDVTELRSLEERLRQTQRMEAVGRLASEVAVNCDALLRDVIRGANDWAGSVGQDPALRHQGERLAADAARAAALLRQLGAYGERQTRALEPVSAQRVLRDLAPVLKRVVGEDIELVLAKSSGPFHVDVTSERLERILINVAGYARQRMTSGGTMKIDLATTAVGRRFVARYPNVRPGDHVLITVTEMPGSTAMTTDGAGRTFDKVGVDLGALVELIGSCGGHLWMEAQPAGNMVVKIHLPKRTNGEAVETNRFAAPADRGGRLARWFRSSSATTSVRA
jgi:PAS domain S-box-containing protein